jgi:ATP adenylyltransferase
MQQKEPLSDQVQALVDFIKNDMKMSHVYQPLLIQSLAESGGQATLRDLAVKFLSIDEAEILGMRKTIRDMPVDVLKRHKVVTRDGELVRLVAPVKDLRERAAIMGACSEVLYDFIQKRGRGIWDYKWMGKKTSSSMRIRVLEDGGRRCALCGATQQDRPLEIDHIVPKSWGGEDVFDNFQILCKKCNQGKSNHNDHDYRLAESSVSYGDCTICSTPSVEEFSTVLPLARLIWTSSESQVSGAAVIPIRHVASYGQLTANELKDIHTLTKRTLGHMQGQDSTHSFSLNFSSVAKANITSDAHIGMVICRNEHM